jgi:hypothetical protein
MSSTAAAQSRRHQGGFVVLLEQLGHLEFLGFFDRQEQAVEAADKLGAEGRTVLVVPVAYAVIQ